MHINSRKDFQLHHYAISGFIWRGTQEKSCYTKALEISSRTLGDDHPWTLTSMSNLAVVYKEQTQYEKTEPLLLKALKGRRLKLGDTHPHTLESWNNLIELYEDWSKPEKAKQWRAKLPLKQLKEQ